MIIFKLTKGKNVRPYKIITQYDLADNTRLLIKNKDEIWISGV